MRAASSLALLAEFIAIGKAILKVSSFKFEEDMGSNGGRVNAFKTIWRDHWGTIRWRGGWMSLSPLRNVLTVGWDKSLAESELSGWMVNNS